ncbi:MAG: hypothetical protein IKO49_06465 [Bacilli bacterium]|nr:hypothetical protein [Bacilli bacterium]
MKFISDDYSVIEQDFNRIIDTLDNIDDKDILVSAYRGLEVFNHILISSDIADRKKLTHLKQTNKNYSLANNIVKKYMIDNLKQFKKDKNFYIDLYKNIFILINNNLQSKYIPNRPYTKISEYDMYRILSLYYIDNDYDSLELFNNRIKQNKVLEIPENDNITGEALSSKLFDTTYITATKTADFEQMITILHENSHAKYFDLIEKNKSHKEYNQFIYQNNFIEVYPEIEEQKFIKFLIDNNLMIEDIKVYLLRKLATLYNGVYKIVKTLNDDKLPSIGTIRHMNGLIYSCLLIEDNIKIEDLKEIENTTLEYYYDDNYNHDDIIEAPIYLVKEIQRLNK